MKSARKMVGSAGSNMVFLTGSKLLKLGLGLSLVFGIAGCNKTPAPAVSTDTSVDQNGGDPADANMASVSGPATTQPAQVLGQRQQNESQQQGEDYSQQAPAPIVRQAPDNGQEAGLTDQQAVDAYATDLTDAQATEPPPPLPDYDQPPAPDPNYLWTPGYWAYAPAGYYWVPGAWCAAPYTGALWTPGYWGFVGGAYRFHHGFWGTHIGFYGGVDYGYGYVGHGYYGGYWRGNTFFYNRTVTHVNTTVIHNVYEHNVVINNVTVNNRTVNHVSYNGGRGGVTARPLPAEVAVLHEERRAPVAAQVQAHNAAAQDKQQFFNQNHGRPATAVAAHPIVAEHQMPAALPRPVLPAQPARIENRPPDNRPSDNRAQPGPPYPVRPQEVAPVRNGAVSGPPNPGARPVPENHPAPPQPQRPPVNQPHPNPQPPAQAVAPPRPESRPATPPRPEPPSQPQQVRPEQATPRVENRPVTPPRVQGPPTPRPAPQPEARPPAPPRPEPAPKAEPHEEERPRAR